MELEVRELRTKDSNRSEQMQIISNIRILHDDYSCLSIFEYSFPYSDMVVKHLYSTAFNIKSIDDWPRIRNWLAEIHGRGGLDASVE